MSHENSNCKFHLNFRLSVYFYHKFTCRDVSLVLFVVCCSNCCCCCASCCCCGGGAAAVGGCRLAKLFGAIPLKRNKPHQNCRQAKRGPALGHALAGQPEAARGRELRRQWQGRSGQRGDYAAKHGMKMEIAVRKATTIKKSCCR